MYPNNNFIFENRAISDFIGNVQMFKPDTRDHFNDQLCSFDKLCLKSNYKGKICKEFVDVTTLNCLIDSHDINEIHELYIDTEGQDYNILMHYDFSIIPLFIRFEHNHINKYNDGRKRLEYNNEVTKLGMLYKKLENLGYTISQDGIDTIAKIII